MSNRPTKKARREEVSKRAKELCEYCLSPEDFSNSTVELDHIIPIAKKGETVSENLAFSCSGCNKYKSQRIEGFDEQTESKVSFYNPRKDVWREHFMWSEDFMEIIGITAKGRVTVKVLRLNRQRVINLRRILILAGEHPPKIER
jgi:hypothetical protein